MIYSVESSIYYVLLQHHVRLWYMKGVHGIPCEISVYRGSSRYIMGVHKSSRNEFMVYNSIDDYILVYTSID